MTASSPNGNAITGWVEGNESAMVFVAATFSTAGGWAPPQVVSTTPLVCGELFVAIDDTGAAAAQCASQVGYNLTVFVAAYDPSGGWSAARSFGESSYWWPRGVALDGYGNPTAVMTRRESSGALTPLASSYDNVTGWSDPVALHGSTAGGTPMIGSDFRGGLRVVFLTSNDVFAVERNGGGAWSSPVGTGRVPFEPVNPTMAVDRNGNVIVSLINIVPNEDGDPYELMRYLSGVGWGSYHTIGSHNADGGIPFPAVTANAAGHAVVTWRGRNASGFPHQVWAATFEPTSGWSEDVLIAEVPVLYATPSAALDENGNVLVTYYDTNGVHAVLHPRGAGWSRPALINLTHASGARMSTFSPTVGEWWICWMAGPWVPTDFNDAVASHFIADFSPPTLTLLGPSSIVSNRSAVEIRGSADPDSQVTAQGGSTNADANGTFTLAVDAPDGNYSLTVIATDVDGNRAQASLSLAIDATPPLLNVTSPAEGDIAWAGYCLVAGVTEPTAALHIQGTPAPHDGGGRFKVALPAGVGGLQVDILATDWIGHTTRFEGGCSGDDPSGNFQAAIGEIELEISNLSRNLENLSADASAARPADAAATSELVAIQAAITQATAASAVAKQDLAAIRNTWTPLSAEIKSVRSQISANPGNAVSLLENASGISVRIREVNASLANLTGATSSVVAQADSASQRLETLPQAPPAVGDVSAGIFLGAGIVVLLLVAAAAALLLLRFRRRQPPPSE